MDRRAKKLEKKRKRRDQKKKTIAIAERNLSSPALLARTATRGPFGPCFISDGWDDLSMPALVTVLVTRKLAGGLLVPGIALADRTCLGIKNGFVRAPLHPRDLAEFVDDVGSAHGGMCPCEPLFAQSIVFHAIDYARSLGFEPHPDFPAALFGSRPAELLNTPWSAPERPCYISGPNDNVRAVMNRLAKTLGPTGFEFADASSDDDDDYDDDDADDLGERDDADVAELVHSALERTVSRGEITLQIQIYRALSDDGWILELEDHRGGSTVWEEPFESDQAALDTALRTIASEGVESFVVAS